MSQSAAVSIKSLLTVGLLAGSLIAVVVLLESPGWRGGNSAKVPAEGDGSPGMLRIAADDARPLDESDADSDEVETASDGAVLALGLEESGAGGVVAAVGDASRDPSLEEPSALPVFWGETATTDEPLREEDGSNAGEIEPGLPSVEPDLETSALDADDELARDRFTELERRLRELGATQYRLETWGAHGELFRFRCWMAISATERYNRFFVVTDPDALTAFEKVLAEVEQWRANQQARAR